MTQTGPALQSSASQRARELFRAEYGHFIDGQWESGASGKTIEQFNPATGEVLGRIQAGSAPDAKRAVDAAARAFAGWSRSSARERQELLLELARRLRARA